MAGVREILASPKIGESGQYSILVVQDIFKSVRRTLMTSFPPWVKTDIPSDTLPPDNQFMGPARVKPLHDDGLSSGESSWMTQSNVSFMPMDLPTGQEDDYFGSSANA